MPSTDADAPSITNEGGDLQSATCTPVDNWVYYVDPAAGLDTASGGSINCPFRSLTHAISAIIRSRMSLGMDAAAPGATIKIVNDGFAPTLGTSTGEVFPIQPPANVTIVANDTTKNLPIIRVTANDVHVGIPPVFQIGNEGAILSHLIVDGSGATLATGIDVESNAGSIDHLIVQNSSAGIFVESVPNSAGFLSLGPGVVVRNNSAVGLLLLAGSVVHIKGGRGIDHTSFSDNGFEGIVVRDLSAVTIDGTNIDPALPDESDVATDNNGVAGLEIGQGGPGVELPANVVHGLHASGNGNGIEMTPCAQLQVRGSYMGKNRQSGLVIAVDSAGFGRTCWHQNIGMIDLGNPNGPDYGRNIFQACNAGTASNANGAICLSLLDVPTWPTIQAAGNIFGTSDCAVGGTLRQSPGCTGQADVGGVPIRSGAPIDFSNCQ